MQWSISHVDVGPRTAVDAWGFNETRSIPTCETGFLPSAWLQTNHNNARTAASFPGTLTFSSLSLNLNIKRRSQDKGHKSKLAIGDGYKTAPEPLPSETKTGYSYTSKYSLRDVERRPVLCSFKRIEGGSAYQKNLLRKIRTPQNIRSPLEQTWSYHPCVYVHGFSLIGIVLRSLGVPETD